MSFVYSAATVEYLLERYFETHYKLEAVDYYADLDRALTFLQQRQPVLHQLALAWASGVSDSELAVMAHVPTEDIRRYLTFTCGQMACFLNDEETVL